MQPLGAIIKLIDETLKKEIPNYKFSVGFDGLDNLRVLYHLTRENECDSINLTDVRAELVNVIYKLMETLFVDVADFTIKDTYISMFSIVQYKINYEKIVFFACGMHGISLSGLHNFIDCTVLKIITPGNVTGGVLSLLKIPSLQAMSFDIFNYDDNPELMQWTSIISSELAGEKNVARAQTQLLRAGLKKFATL
jgi:hypothetical protein